MVDKRKKQKDLPQERGGEGKMEEVGDEFYHEIGNTAAEDTPVNPETRDETREETVR